MLLLRWAMKILLMHQIIVFENKFGKSDLFQVHHNSVSNKTYKPKKVALKNFALSSGSRMLYITNANNMNITNIFAKFNLFFVHKIVFSYICYVSLFEILQLYKIRTAINLALHHNNVPLLFLFHQTLVTLSFLPIPLFSIFYICSHAP